MINMLEYKFSRVISVVYPDSRVVSQELPLTDHYVIDISKGTIWCHPCYYGNLVNF